jgi:hypothetical protein
MDTPAVPDSVLQLVEQFDHHFDVYHSPKYNEETAPDKTAIDRQIDQLVYELYGLTEEETRIVEGGENR